LKRKQDSLAKGHNLAPPHLQLFKHNFVSGGEGGRALLNADTTPRDPFRIERFQVVLNFVLQQLKKNKK
jgi:hypothetical protein